MSVLGYLERRASNAVLSETEKTSITRSISTISSRLSSFFSQDVKEQFRFGSSMRGTILPRFMDDYSDIDYMVVFKDDGSTPQTYLNRLKRFAETHYQRSEIYQSSPTIVLELGHIKFDLVPAKRDYLNGLKIPDSNAGWQDTNPNDFNQKLEDKNKNNQNLIKPTIRLAKFWNASNGYLYDSFLFEKWIVERWFSSCTNQKDYLFAVFDNLISASEQTQWRKDKIVRAQQIIANVRNYERQGLTAQAEQEVKKLIPE